MTPARVWAFPKGKPQWFAGSSAALAASTLGYPLVRRVPRALRVAAVFLLALPLSRRLGSEQAWFAVPSDDETWTAIRDSLVPPGAGVRSWVFFQSQWRVSRFGAIAIGRFGRTCAFVAVMPTAELTFHPTFVGRCVRIPAVEREVVVGEWTGRRFEVVPRLARTPSSWDDVVAVGAEVSALLAGDLPRPAGTPSHWQPMHGDFTPSNLREDHRGNLWLLDWEEAAWAPPAADVVRYAMAFRSLQHDDVDGLVDAILTDVPATTEEVAEAAHFWTQHRNFALDTGEGPVLTERKASDLDRGRRERRAFEALARLAG